MNTLAVFYVCTAVVVIVERFLVRYFSTESLAAREAERARDHERHMCILEGQRDGSLYQD